MDFIFTFIQSNWRVVLIIYSVLLLLLLIVTLYNLVSFSTYKKKYKKLMRGMDNKNLEVFLNKQQHKIQQFDEKISDFQLKLKVAERNLDTCIQKIGIIRYDAFKDVSSKLSFSIALLDNSNSGLILTSLYSRNNSTMYAKPIKYGKSEYPLSEEEQKAIANALNIDI